MADIAKLAYEVDSSDLVRGTAALESHTKAAQRTEAASVKLERQMGGLTKAVGAAGVALASAFVAGGALVGVTVLRWMRDVERLGSQLDSLARVANTSSQDLQGWGYAAESVGVSTGSLAGMLQKTQDGIGDFLATGGGPLKDFFEDIAPRVGMTADQFARLSGTEALGAYYTALQRANLTQAETAYHLNKLGEDAAMLDPLLRDNARGFREWSSEAERLGAIIDTDTMQAIRGMREQGTRLTVVMDGMKIALAKELLPAFGRFTDLLSDPGAQRGLSNMIGLLGQAAGAAVTFAEKIGQAGIAYRDFLANQGALPAGMLDQEAQLEERIRKLSRIVHGNDPINSARMALFGDSFRQQLREAVEELNGFQWRNVISGSSTVPAGGVRPPSGGDGGGAGGGRRRDLPDFSSRAIEELQELLAIEEQARAEFDAWAAQLNGPVADANYRYAEDLKRMRDLAGEGAIGSRELAQAEELLRREHEANIDAIQRRLDPGRELLEQLEFERRLVNMTNAERATAIQLRDLDAESVRKYGQAVAEANREIEAAMEAEENWRQVQRGISDGLFDIATGAESARGAIGNFLDDLNRQMLRNISDDWAESITDWLKGFGGGGAGGSGGGFWSNLIGAMFGGGRAYGGGVRDGRFYRVGEGDRPELLNLGRGRQYLIPGDAGRVEPMSGRASGPAPVHVNQTIQVTGTIDKRSADQIARQTFLEGRRAFLRNG